MPKVRILERDITANTLSGTTEQIVYVPLGASELKLYTSRSDFDNDFLTIGESEEKEVAYVNPDLLEGEEKKLQIVKLACSKMLDLGLHILVGSNIEKDTESIREKTQFDIKMLYGADACEIELEDEGDKKLKTLKSFLKVAVDRRDCFVVLDNTKELSSDVITLLSQHIDVFAPTDKFLKQEIKKPIGKYATGFITKNLKVFFDGIVTLEGAYDSSYTGTIIPGGLAYLLSFAESVRTGNSDYLAIAGASRGKVLNAVDSGYFTQAEIDKYEGRIYAESGDTIIGLNVITKINGIGVVIWGNRTMLPNDSTNNPEEDDLVASSFLNVRVLTCDIKKALFRAATLQQFEQNTDILWFNFKSSFVPLLDEMRINGGIRGYKIQRLASTERAKVNCKVTIVPIEAVEDFDIEVELGDSLTSIEETE